MNGLVLSGGKSSRMGTPKAEIAYDGVPEYIRCTNVLNLVCEHVFLSTSEFWTPSVAPAHALLLPDPVGSSFGPLTGIAQAFRRAPDAALVVFACDMPLFDNQALLELEAQRDPTQDATCFALDGTTPEPLCAIYEPSAAHGIFRALENDVRCARRVIDGLQVKRVVPSNADWVRNINDKNEYERFIARRPEVNVDVFFVAQLRETAGKSFERVATQRLTPKALFEDLRARYGFKLRPEHMRVAINDEIVDWAKSLRENDQIMFVPPVAGG